MPIQGELSGTFVSRLDRNLAIAGIAVGIVFTFLLINVAPDYIGVGIVLSISCVLYLSFIRRAVSFGGISVARLFSSSSYLLFNILFFALLSYSTVVLYFSIYERPLGYFISMALMSTLVALEVFAIPGEAKGRSALILMKILIISLILRWSLFYLYPGSLLGQDPWWSAVTFDNISRAGHLMPDMGVYYYAPIQYLMVVITSQLTGVAIREAMILSVSLFEVVSLVFIFLLARHIFGTRVGLLSALILGVNNLHVMWGWWVHAQAVGIALVALALFLILSPRTHNAANFKVISFSVLILLILAHSVSSFVMLIILAVLYAGYRIYAAYRKNEAPYISGNITLLFCVALLGYWLYVTHSFNYFVAMITGHGLGEAGGGSIPYAPTLITKVNPAWAQINRLGNLLFYGLAGIGVLSTLNPRHVNASRFNLTFCGISLTGIVFIQFFLFPVDMATGRWFIFMDILLAIPAAIGLIAISNATGGNRKKVTVLAVMMFILAFLMVSNATAAFDSPIYPGYLKSRAALMESELRAADTIEVIYPDTIVMDVTHALALEDSPRTLVEGLSYQDVQAEFQGVGGLLVLRRYIVDNEFSALTDGGSCKAEFTYDPYQALRKTRFNRIYDSGTVSAYLR